MSARFQCLTPRGQSAADKNSIIQKKNPNKANALLGFLVNSIFRYETVADRIYKTHYLLSRAYDLCGDNKKAEIKASNPKSAKKENENKESIMLEFWPKANKEYENKPLDLNKNT